MNIQLIKEPVNHLIIDNYYEESEINSIMRELLYFQANDKLKTPDNTASAMLNNVPQKENRAVFLDDVYSDRNMSDILNINRKTYNVFSKNSYKDKFAESWFFNTVVPRRDYTLINYYEDGNYYKPHVDTSIATCVSFFYQKPKKWSGGKLILTDFNHTIEPKFARMVVFPSMLRHEVTPIKMEEKYKGSNFGRFTITQFMETSEK